MPAPDGHKEFRAALGLFATGVAVVTSRAPTGKDIGLTITSFNSVSLDPPMVLWSLGRSSSNYPAFSSVDAFAVHVLSAEQEQVCRQFSTSGIDRFAGLDCTRGLSGVPLIPGCAAVFECEVCHRYEGGDHVIVVGKVLSFASSHQVPLVFWRGRIDTPFGRAQSGLGVQPPTARYA